MTHRERMIRALAGQRADRAPLPMWLGFSPWGDTLNRWRAESGIADLNVGTYFGFERFGQAFPADRFGPWPHFEKKVIRKDDEFVWSIDYRGITRRDRIAGTSMPEWIDHPIKSADDWRRYKAERLVPRLDARMAELDRFVAQAATIDAPVQFGSFPWGMFGTARDLLGAEGVLVAFYDQPDLILDIMESHTTLWLAMVDRLAARVQVDHIHIWEDMSGRQGSLISPAMMVKFMMPQYDRVVAFARSHGVPVVSVDTDGLMDQIVATMVPHGINSFMPFEVQAGSDIEWFAREYPALGLMGGLDKRALAGTRSDVNHELDRAGRLLARGGWVPGFDHSIPPDASWDNFKHFVENLKRMIGL